jgi:integrase
MVSLKRAPNGDWFARKAVPSDLREAYRAAHGVAREELFRRQGSLSTDRAKQELREWDAAISSRISALRAAARGEGRSLTHREAHALAGDWYIWFVSENEDEPGEPDQWDFLLGELEDAYSRFAPLDFGPGHDDGSWMQAPAVRRTVHAVLTSRGDVERFLAVRSVTLNADARELLLDKVEEEFIAALNLLRRRAEGDYGKDPRPERFPTSTFATASAAGHTCWKLFEAWVNERRPAPSTVNRWRSVFLTLEKKFEGRDIASISGDDAIRWKGTLVTGDRSPEVANDIWLTAARTVFAWALANKMISSNPFAGVSIAMPAKLQELREREFNEEEWQRILTATLVAPPARMTPANAMARRWVAWICAYTGSRPGEVTQLRAQDVQQQNGLWVIRITPDAGAVKGRRARTVPLHEHLIEQGFVEFARDQGSGPLFYDAERKRRETTDPLRPVRPAWVKAREKLAEWVRSLGVTDPNISPNHAWRHTFKRRAARAGIERTVRDAICGHKLRDVGDKYEAPTVEDMARELKKFPRYEF